MKWTVVAITLLAIACNREQDRATTAGGNPGHGKQLVQQSGCTMCHIVPEIPGPRGMVGPSLEHFATRGTIAGKLPNSPENLIKYLQNPQAADPQNSMPNLGIQPNDAKDITAFLYTLK